MEIFYAFLLDINRGAELHSHGICISSALVGCVQKFSEVVMPIYFLSIQQHIRSLVLHLVSVWYFLSLVFQPFWWVWCSISLQFQKANEVEHYYFICFLCWACIHSLVKYPWKSIAPLLVLIGLTIFFGKSSSYIMDMGFLKYALTIYSPFGGLLVHSLMIALREQNSILSVFCI